MPLYIPYIYVIIFLLSSQVHGINGQNFRLFKDNLEKDIVPAESKFIVKRNKVVLKLQKVSSFLHSDNGAICVVFFVF